MTRYEDLPLMYKHREQEGTLILTWDVNTQDRIIPGRFIWAIQQDDASVSAMGKVKGLDKLNKIRNQFILDKWELYQRPKYNVKDDKEAAEARKKEELEMAALGNIDLAALETKIDAGLTDADRLARAKAVEDINKGSALSSFSKWLLEE